MRVCKFCKIEIPDNKGGFGDALRLHVDQVRGDMCENCRRKIEVQLLNQKRQAGREAKRRERMGF